MEYQTPKIGDRADKLCAICGRQTGQVIKSINKKGVILRVECSICGLIGSFRPSAKLDETDPVTKKGAPYDRTKTYRTGQTIEHSVFGTGEVTTVLSAKTIDVLFSDRVRRLIHAR